MSVDTSGSFGQLTWILDSVFHRKWVNRVPLLVGSGSSCCMWDSGVGDHGGFFSRDQGRHCGVAGLL